MIVLIVFIVCLYSSLNAQFNLYQTDRLNPFEFDCLYFYLGDEQFKGPQFVFPTYQKISYCRRPLERIDNDVLQAPFNVNEKYTFEQLEQLNVTTEQLLSWSASIDQVERYAFYRSRSILNHSLASEEFWNCSLTWFGSQCQYSFLMSSNVTLAGVIQTTFEAKKETGSPIHTFTNLTCYQLLKCRRAEFACLDWRDICNGRIDCEDDGADEEHCWQLEVNECGPDEYRCHNGLCVPNDFFNDDRNNPDCLDRTDEIVEAKDFELCYKDPTFRCEEQTCHPHFDSFSCGDGHCVSFEPGCKNNRHLLLIEHASLLRGNLSEKCWTVTTCLLNINSRRPLGKQTCSRLLPDSNVTRRYLNECETTFQFPIFSPVHGHVRFLYFNNRTDAELSLDKFFFPNLICYDQRLCDTLPSSYIDGNSACLTWKEFNKTLFNRYIDVLSYATRFFKTCSSRYVWPEGKEMTLYRCQDSSKFIGKNRLLDRIQDCPKGDDEQYNETCSLNDPFRFKCDERVNKCYAPIFNRIFCHKQEIFNYTELDFHDFCDGRNSSLRQTIDGFNHTDETHCENWPCNNLYTRCNAHVDCPNREDESNCIKSDCPIGFHPCISLKNFTAFCSPSESSYGQSIDCLEAANEPKLCLKNKTSSKSKHSSRCWHDESCNKSFSVCITAAFCTDTTNGELCAGRKDICLYQSLISDETRRETCQFFNEKFAEKRYFRSESITTIPKTNKSRTNTPFHTQSMQTDDKNWFWRCNRGLYVRFERNGSNGSYRCFCPPSYYGDYCQYQSQRVSLTLELLAVNRRSTYSFVVRLIDNMSQTVAYDQFSMMGIWGCDRSFNIYLLYPDRPKDPHNNYSLHIDAYDRSTLTYWASWFVPIPFQFLPVNRIAAQLKVPGKSIMSTGQCYIDRRTSQRCCRYYNNPETFCRSDAQCHGCSSDSLCVGILHDQPICLCPMHKTGPRCALDVSCPPARCSNHGQCVLLGHHTTNDDYICACDEQYYGVRCEQMKTQLHITLEDMETSPFIIAHQVTVYTDDKPDVDIDIQKLHRDQRSVTFSLVEPIHLIFIQNNDHYYLTHIDSMSTEFYGTLSRCPHINTLMNRDLLVLPPIRLIKQYHIFCANLTHLSCFIDDFYTCLCTSDRHANCFRLEPYSNPTCEQSDYCENDGICYQDIPLCPSKTVCFCPHCYFGSRCQFYAKGFGVTLDDILRYEFRHHLPLSGQKISVKISAILTSLMFVLGSISSLLSFLTFRRPAVRTIGCGLYLFTVSFTSFFTVVLLNIKFWFIIAGELNLITNPKILRSGCIAIEPLLKIIFNVDNWFKACVAIERSFMIFHGVYFNKVASLRLARWVILILPIIIAGSCVHEFIYRDAIDDEEGFYQHWCITNYPSSSWKNYNTIILIGHFFVPFIVNLSSTLFIIVSLARQQSFLRQKHRYRTYLCRHFNEHKQTLISPIILVVLSSPRIITSLMSSCIDSSHDPRWYLTAYFISFIPSVLTFVVFVLPSRLYQTEFRKHFRPSSDNS